METLFWDVDTQIDFMVPDGALYVEGAEQIKHNLKSITDYARDNGRLMGSVDYHRPEDPELSDDPDFEETFPPHCLADSDGQQKISETRPEDPLWVGTEPKSSEDIQEITEHDGSVYFQKQQFDVFTNPNVEPVINEINPFQIAIYGVTLDVCVQHAIQGFLSLNQQITLISDATRALDENQRQTLEFNWKNLGVQVIDTEEALSGHIL